MTGEIALHKIENVNTTDMKLIQVLECRRVEAGISQTEFSRRAGYSYDAWEKALTGRHVISLKKFTDHAEVLGYSFRLMRDS